MTGQAYLNVVAVALVAVSTGLPLPAGGAEAAAANDPYAKLPTYDFGQSRRPLSAIETEIRKSSPAQHKAIELKLLKVLQSPKATFACKQFICRMLRRIGTAHSVPALAKLLADEKLSHMARFALQSIDGDEAGAALRDALAKVKGRLKVGVIGSIGARRDHRAVAELAKLVGDKDPQIAGAAIAALGHIGNSQAAGALAGAKVPAKLKTTRDDAYLQCADGLLAAGKTAEATAIYRKMYVPGSATAIRIAALRGIAQAEQAKAVPTVVAAMKDKDLKLQRAAGKFLAGIKGPEASKAIAEQLPSLSAPVQVVMLASLGERGDKIALPAVIRAVKSKDANVRVAAIRVVGKLGDESEIAMLLGPASAGGNEATAAIAALTYLVGDKVNPTMIEMMQKAQPARAKLLIQVLADRRATQALGAVMRALGDNPDKGVKNEAAKALAALATEKDVPALLKLLAKVDGTFHGAVVKAVVVAARPQKDPDKRVEPIVAAMPGAAPDVKVSLLSILGRLGGKKALSSVRSALGSKDANVIDAAVKALADWKDPSAAPDLLKIARTAKTKVHKILAFRGYVRLAGELAKQGKLSEATKMLAGASTAAERPEEKKLVLGALGAIRTVEALKLAVAFLDDPAVNREAGHAAVELAKHLHKRHGKEVSAAMAKVVASCKDARIVNEAGRYIQKKKAG